VGNSRWRHNLAIFDLVALLKPRDKLTPMLVAMLARQLHLLQPRHIHIYSKVCFEVLVPDRGFQRCFRTQAEHRPAIERFVRAEEPTTDWSFVNFEDSMSAAPAEHAPRRGKTACRSGQCR